MIIAILKMPTTHPMHRMKRRLYDMMGGCRAVQDDRWPRIRAHLDRHYCARCGEYMFCSDPERTIRHGHHGRRRRYKIQSMLMTRILFHHDLGVVEWERRFPRVGRLPHATGRAARIPALRLWTREEWDLSYPMMTCKKNEFFTRLRETSLDPMFVPEWSY